MTRTSDMILMAVFGTVFVFSLLAVMFGETAALWLARIVTAGVLISLAAWGIIKMYNALSSLKHQRALDARKAEAEVRRMEKDAGLVSVHKLHGPGQLLAVDHTGETPRISSYGYHPDVSQPRIESQQAGGLPALEAPAAVQPVMPLIHDALSLVLIGPQGTGKTTLLQHVIDSRHGESLIIDPHGFRGKYPDHARIIGEGRNYEEIQACMDDILDQLNERYEAYQGQEFPPFWIYIDELTLLHKHTENFQQFMMVMLTEARKVGMKLTVCVHSRRVKFMGLERAGDLADGITFVSLKKNKKTGERWAELETEEENIQMALPGPYTRNTKNHHTPRCTPVYTGSTPSLHPDYTGPTPAGTPPVHPEYQFDFQPAAPSEMPFKELVRRVTLVWNSLPENRRTVTGVSKFVFRSKSTHNNNIIREILGAEA